MQRKQEITKPKLHMSQEELTPTNHRDRGMGSTMNNSRNYKLDIMIRDKGGRTNVNVTPIRN